MADAGRATIEIYPDSARMVRALRILQRAAEEVAEALRCAAEDLAAGEQGDD